MGKENHKISDILNLKLHLFDEVQFTP